MADQGSKLGVQFHPIPETLTDQFRQDFPRFVDGLVRADPGGLAVPVQFAARAEEIYNFRPRADDAWIVTFPKSGTTWVQEMMWLIVNDCDFQRAKEKLQIRSPYVEIPLLRKSSVLSDELAARMAHSVAATQGIEFLNQLPSPRVLKSHLPFYMLPPELLDTCKVVYVARNPKDVIVSFFYHHKLIKFYDYRGDMDNFVDYFMKDQLIYSPYFGHVLEAWNLRHHPNLLFLFYEDLQKDLKGQVKKVADFLQKSLTDEQLQRLTDHLSFDKFQVNEAVNFRAEQAQGLFNVGGKFIRKGITGDWKNHFGAELNAQVDRWIESNLEGSDLKFVTELD